MNRYGKAVYACDYAGFEKQDWGYYTRGKNDEVYMVVFNQPYSERLIVKTPKGITVKISLLLRQPAMNITYLFLKRIRVNLM